MAMQVTWSCLNQWWRWRCGKVLFWIVLDCLITLQMRASVIPRQHWNCLLMYGCIVPIDFWVHISCLSSEMSFIWYCYEKTYQSHPPCNIIITNMKFTVRNVAVSSHYYRWLSNSCPLKSSVLGTHECVGKWPERLSGGRVLRDTHAVEGNSCGTLSGGRVLRDTQWRETPVGHSVEGESWVETVLKLLNFK